MSTVPQIPAAQYVRASTDRQEYSATNQMTVIAEYAERNGFSIIKTYDDDDPATSGVVLRRRKGLQKLIKAKVTFLGKTCKLRNIVQPDIDQALRSGVFPLAKKRADFKSFHGHVSTHPFLIFQMVLWYRCHWISLVALLNRQNTEILRLLLYPSVPKSNLNLPVDSPWLKQGIEIGDMREFCRMVTGMSAAD